MRASGARPPRLRIPKKFAPPSRHREGSVMAALPSQDDTVATTAEDIARREGGKRSGAGFSIRCPCASHGKDGHDRNASAFVADRTDDDAKGEVYAECYGGCD